LEKITNLDSAHNTNGLQSYNYAPSNKEMSLKLALDNWDYFKTLLVRLEHSWKQNYTSYKKRIEFLSRIEKVWDYLDICSRVKLEIEFLEDFTDRNSHLLQLMKKREMLKA
jgi:hypothetical protein